MPLFSVIIPVYNSESYLIECVNSVLKQQYGDAEIILIEDCSTDKSGEICIFLAQQYDSIIAIQHTQNQGVGISRNDGIRIAQGRYIIFLDSDDRLLNGCFTGIEKVIKKNPNVDVITRRHIIDRHGYANTETACWNHIVNKDFILKNNLLFNDAKVGEDEAYTAILLCSMKSCAFYDGDFYWHRTRNDSLSTSIDAETTQGYFKVLTDMTTFAHNNDLSDTKRAFMHSRIQRALGCYNARMMIQNRQKIVSLVANRQYEKLFVFCAGIYGMATLSVLQGQGYHVDAILDDNPALEGTFVLGVPVSSSSILFNMPTSDVLCIVSNQHTKSFNSISQRLMEKGLQEEQIAQMVF